MNTGAVFGPHAYFNGLRKNRKIGSVTEGGSVYAHANKVFKFSRNRKFTFITLMFDTPLSLCNHPYMQRYTQEEITFIEKCNNIVDVCAGYVRIKIPAMMRYTSTPSISHTALNGETYNISSGAVYKDELTHEYNIMKTINHPNVVRVYAYHVQYKRHCAEQLIVMQRCQQDIASWISNEPDQESIIGVLFQVLYTCATLWNDYKIMHRDVHFGNLLICRQHPQELYTVNGTKFRVNNAPLVKLSDFALAIKWEPPMILCNDNIGNVFEDVDIPDYPCSMYDQLYACRLFEDDVAETCSKCLTFILGDDYEQYFDDDDRPIVKKIPKKTHNPSDTITQSGAFEQLKVREG